MTKRMWASTQTTLDISGNKGYFDVSYGTESEAQKLDIWLPDHNHSPFPVLFMIHGGGFTALDKRSSEANEFILEGIHRGYAVVSTNYRMNDVAIFPFPVMDVKQAIRYIQANATKYNLDPSRLIIFGGSAGGYLTLMAVLNRNNPYFDNKEDSNIEFSPNIKGAIALYPVTDFAKLDYQLKVNSLINKSNKKVEDISESYVEAFPLSEEDSFPFHNTEDSVCSIFLGSPLPESAVSLRHANPISHINSNVPPILIQHGSGDEIIPMQQSINFTLQTNEICKEERVICDILPGAIHGSVKFHSEENMNRIFKWVEQVMSTQIS
ncbi:alpha/beta hydrolase fold domain-containing protein [Paenibacillus sp. GCM10027628]|uniref:alpha/beta hydrolase fold domain-containing protein n=1 Tax=Paenibacillus sp. GCM10027628 TaxID=3273413 RepID=UPI003639ACDB